MQQRCAPTSQMSTPQQRHTPSRCSRALGEGDGAGAFTPQKTKVLAEPSRRVACWTAGSRRTRQPRGTEKVLHRRGEVEAHPAFHARERLSSAADVPPPATVRHEWEGNAGEWWRWRGGRVSRPSRHSRHSRQSQRTPPRQQAACWPARTPGPPALPLLDAFPLRRVHSCRICACSPLSSPFGGPPRPAGCCLSPIKIAGGTLGDPSLQTPPPAQRTRSALSPFRSAGLVRPARAENCIRAWRGGGIVVGWSSTPDRPRQALKCPPLAVACNGRIAVGHLRATSQQVMDGVGQGIHQDGRYKKSGQEVSWTGVDAHSIHSCGSFPAHGAAARRGTGSNWIEPFHSLPRDRAARALAVAPPTDGRPGRIPTCPALSRGNTGTVRRLRCE